jgi:hypothetical protein
MINYNHGGTESTENTAENLIFLHAFRAFVVKSSVFSVPPW